MRTETLIRRSECTNFIACSKDQYGYIWHHPTQPARQWSLTERAYYVDGLEHCVQKPDYVGGILRTWRLQRKPLLLMQFEAYGRHGEPDFTYAS